MKDSALDTDADDDSTSTQRKSMPSTLPIEDTEVELAKYKAIFDILTRLNTKANTSHAVQELVSSIQALLHVRTVVVYLISHEDDDESGSETSGSPSSITGRAHARRSAAQERFVYPFIANQSERIETFYSRQPVSADPLESMVGYVASTAETVVLNDLPNAVAKALLSPQDPLAGFTNAVLIPITFGLDIGTVGVLQCVDKQFGENGFSEMDVTILEAIAANAGNVLHKLVLFDNALAAQRKASALLELANASRHIREDSHVHLPNLIERLLMSVYRIMRADRVSLYLCDETKRELWCCISKDFKGSRIPYGAGIIGTVANSGQMLNIRDCYQDRRFNRKGDMMTGYNTRSMLAAPVTSSAGNLVAVIVVINKIALRGTSEPIMPPLDEATKYTMASTPSTSSSVHAVANEWDIYQDNIPLQTLSPEDFADAAVDPTLVAGITHFTREDEMVLESVSTEVGNILERNALDAHYENVINGVLNERKRGYAKVLTASLLAETTTSSAFQGDVAGLAQRTTASVLFRKGRRSKAVIFQMVSRWAAFFRAVGIFSRILRRIRGFKFSVKKIEKCPCTLRRTLSENTKKIKMLARRSASSEVLDHVGTRVCPGAQYVLDIDSSCGESQITEETRRRSREWCMDVFGIDTHTTVHLFRLSLEDLGLMERFSMSKSTVISFLHAIKNAYLPKETCPYHNWEHAFGVFQMCYAALCSTKLSEVLLPVDQLALLVGALGHDAGHEGRNNDFEVKVGSDLAIRYNDASVLEQHHAAVLFQVLKHPANNILRFTTRQTEIDFRRATISAILATDMSSHFDHVKKVSNRIADVSLASQGLTCVYSSASTQDRSELVNFVLHSIDIGGQCYPHEQSQIWSSRLIQEFIAQATDEVNLGFQPAPYMVGLASPLRQAILQKSFTENIVQPAWRLIQTLLPECDSLLLNLQTNINHYAQQVQELEQAENEDFVSASTA